MEQKLDYLGLDVYINKRTLGFCRLEIDVDDIIRPQKCFRPRIYFGSGHATLVVHGRLGKGRHTKSCRRCRV